MKTKTTMRNPDSTQTARHEVMDEPVKWGVNLCMKFALAIQALCFARSAGATTNDEFMSKAEQRAGVRQLDGDDDEGENQVPAKDVVIPVGTGDVKIPAPKGFRTLDDEDPMAILMKTESDADTKNKTLGLWVATEGGRAAGIGQDTTWIRREDHIAFRLFKGPRGDAEEPV